MRTLILIVAFISVQAFAGDTILEFDQAQEQKCHAEIKALKCVDQAGEEMSDCVESKKAKLSTECKNIHTAKRNNK